MSAPFPVQGDAPVRVLFIEELSRLIGKAPTTIRTCATNAKYLHLIPRPFKMPNSRRLCWWESDVLAWINASREPL
ncbi:helix-turn-helix transcriptional regulator, partial [Burkholderia pseudomallei]|uniref:helix-turn-helix transcriptional regulator n=1 Tax=Burkholderia pseudomallei TaxID=28450 RepID=UPI00399D778A